PGALRLPGLEDRMGGSAKHRDHSERRVLTGKDSLDQLVAEAEGAYTAVEQANADGGSTPKIRLVLAGMGSGERHWKDAVDQLKLERNLVAVTGMGLARAESVDAARELSDAGIPMVADLITADGFDTGAVDDKGSIKGLVRVGFTNTALLTAVGNELAGQKHTAAVVRSVTSNQSPDPYTESLYHDFLSLNGLKKHLLPAAGFTVDPRRGPNSFLNIIGPLCDIAPAIDTVYFAARETYLPDFLTALSQRPCLRQQLTVVTGSGTADLHLTTDALRRLDASITVLYASLPTSTALQSDSNRDRSLYDDFLQAFTRDHHGQAFVAAHATLGHSAVLAHDAVLTVATAIHKAATTATDLPGRYAVSDQLYTLTDNAVPGAGGRFGIDATGNRTTAPVTVNRLKGTP
ncbi:hypothetical protein PV333_31250, partial [Streptomyces sp. NY05-11A]|nr:hypothetical protein [Streptomyces sp. NY05-11A]